MVFHEFLASLIFYLTVNEAIVINDKLERQQKHHGCVVSGYQDELATTKEELLRLTTKLSIEQHADKMVASDSSIIKDLDHQLKMVGTLISLCIKYCIFTLIAKGLDCFIREADRRTAERERIDCQCSQ